VPPFRTALLTHFHTFTVLILPGDSDTWSVTFFAFTGDQPLKAVRDVDKWAAAIRACPLHAHLLDGEPVSNVLAMAGVTSRARRLVVKGNPVVTGMVSVGDAQVCTNPIGGRGITMGLLHAAGTADVITEHLDDPLALALTHDAMTEAKILPWYHHTVSFDRDRSASVNAYIRGLDQPRPEDPSADLQRMMAFDADLFRAGIEIYTLLALPEEVMSRPGIAERVKEMANTHQPMTPPGPTREELLRIVA
jgi:2-polyprenyl-6-methoxyphenol hydroxylase-like FAD-dependent oxidoreductase